MRAANDGARFHRRQKGWPNQRGAAIEGVPKPSVREVVHLPPGPQFAASDAPASGEFHDRGNGPVQCGAQTVLYRAEQSEGVGVLFGDPFSGAKAQRLRAITSDSGNAREDVLRGKARGPVGQEHLSCDEAFRSKSNVLKERHRRGSKDL